MRAAAAPVLTMRDPDPRPGQPEQPVIEAKLTAQGALTGWSGRARHAGQPAPGLRAGIQIHVEHLADYIAGRELRNVEARWNELFPAYEALGVSEQALGVNSFQCPSVTTSTSPSVTLIAV